MFPCLQLVRGKVMGLLGHGATKVSQVTCGKAGFCEKTGSERLLYEPEQGRATAADILQFSRESFAVLFSAPLQKFSAGMSL